MNQNPNINRRPVARGWRELWMNRFGMNTKTMPLGKNEVIIPSWLTGKSIVFFFVALMTCWMFFGNVPELDLALPACISVVIFFYGGLSMSKSWSRKKDKKFARNVFITALVIRLIWVLYLYYVFNPNHYGNLYGDDADTGWYMDFGKDITAWLSGTSKYTLSQVIDINRSAIDDVGYPMWLGIVYLIFGVNNDVFIPFVLKGIMSAYCALCMYNVAKRHYGEGVGRMTAIFVALNPNLIYWSCTMMKETEMVFLVCLAIDNFDRVLTSGQRFTFKNLLPGMLAAIALFFFRTALALAIFMAFFAHIVMVSQRVMSTGKKVLAGLLVAVTLGIGVGDSLRERATGLYSLAQSDAQAKNMEWRSTRSGGNSFAKYAGAAVFAPLIVTIPFPTFNQAEEGQLVQVQLSGGSYIKNILSFFVIMVFLMMLISGEWRRHVFILAYTVGYLGILVVSAYAQSGRFHMPVIPFLMLFAAYGVQIAKTNIRLRKWFPMVLVLEVFVCLVWNWFKLKGRGMI